MFFLVVRKTVAAKDQSIIKGVGKGVSKATGSVRRRAAKMAEQRGRSNESIAFSWAKKEKTIYSLNKKILKENILNFRRLKDRVE